MAPRTGTSTRSTFASVFGTAKSLAFLGTVFGIEKLVHAFGVDEHSAAGLGMAFAQFLTLSAHAMHASREASRMDREEQSEESERDRLFNHDLAKAVARSIHTILTGKSLLRDETLPNAERKALRRAADQAEVVWLGIVKDHAGAAPDDAFAPLLEDSVRDAITLNPANPKFPEWGEPEMWRRIIRAMADAAGKKVTQALAERCPTLTQAVAACRTGFARQFYNDIKRDLADPRGGAAFAAVHLRMMGEVVLGVRELVKDVRDLEKLNESFRREFEKLHREHHDLLDLVKRNHREIIELFAQRGAGMIRASESRMDSAQFNGLVNWFNKLDANIEGHVQRLHKRHDRHDDSIESLHLDVLKVHDAVEDIKNANHLLDSTRLESAADFQGLWIKNLISNTCTKMMFSGVNFHIVLSDRRMLLFDRICEGVVFQLLFVDPQSPLIEEAAQVFGVEAEELRRESETTIMLASNLFKEVRRKLGGARARQLLLWRYQSVMPRARYYLFDPDSTSGRVAFVRYVNGLRSSHSPVQVISVSEAAGRRFIQDCCYTWESGLIPAP